MRSVLHRTISRWAAAGLLALPALALAHAERQTPSPPRPGSVPDQGRTHIIEIDVCKVDDAACEFEHIQAAVNAASDGALIRIWPGFYKEEPSRMAPFTAPDNPDGTYSYDHQVANPNSQNLIAIFGKKNVTLRGMGADPEDVVIDVEFKKHVGIRGDRTDGLIIENLSVWHAFDHGVYVLETGGFVLDRVHSGYSREYPFLTFANDHGLMKDCKAFGGGDAGIYPGGSADTPGRPSMEVSHCKSYGNVLGYSGSNGDHVWVHDSEFYGNSIGFVSDSLTDHPNYPQNNLVFENNLVYDNNLEVYGPNSNIKPTVFTNSILIPVGVGIFLATGDENLVQNNHIWGNDRFGVWLASGQGLVIGPTSDPAALPIVSSGNRFIGNTMAPPPVLPAGASSDPNGTDFAWDGMGLGNCWQNNQRAAGAATSDPPILPPCRDPVLDRPMPATAFVPWLPNLIAQGMLVFVQDPTDGDRYKPLCNIVGYEPCQWSPEHPTAGRNTPEGYVPPTPPTACGPSSC